MDLGGCHVHVGEGLRTRGCMSCGVWIIIVPTATVSSQHLLISKVLARRRIKEGWWLLDQSIFVVLMHSYDHIKDNLL